MESLDQRCRDDIAGELHHPRRAPCGNAYWIHPTGWGEPAHASAKRAIAVFERVGDDRSLARAWEVVHLVHWIRGELAAARRAAERGLAHAESAGDQRQAGRHRMGATASAHFGLVPFDRIRDERDRNLAWARETGSLWIEAMSLMGVGTHQAARGDRVAGRRVVDRAMAIAEALGMRPWAAAVVANWIRYVTDDPCEIERHLRASFEILADVGEKGTLSAVAPGLADALYRQGRFAEAREILASDAVESDDEDVASRAEAGAVRAKLLMREGRYAEAEQTAGEAVALARRSEYVDARGDTLMAFAEVLDAVGRRDEAAELVNEAIELWDFKGNVVFARRARALRETLVASAPAS